MNRTHSTAKYSSAIHKYAKAKQYTHPVGGPVSLMGLYWLSQSILMGNLLCFIAWLGTYDFYFEEIRVFTAGNRLEYVSME